MQIRWEAMKLHKHFYIAAVALYTLLLFLVFRDEILQISRISTSNPGDQRLNFLFMQWGLEWLLGDVYRGAEGFFSLGIFHPYQNALALSSNHLGSLPINLLLNLVSLVWVSLRGQPGAILRAKRDALYGLSPMLAKRRQIQAQRKSDDRALRGAMSGAAALFRGRRS